MTVYLKFREWTFAAPPRGNNYHNPSFLYLNMAQCMPKSKMDVKGWIDRGII